MTVGVAAIGSDGDHVIRQSWREEYSEPEESMVGAAVALTSQRLGSRDCAFYSVGAMFHGQAIDDGVKVAVDSGGERAECG